MAKQIQTSAAENQSKGSRRLSSYSFFWNKIVSSGIFAHSCDRLVTWAGGTCLSLCDSCIRLHPQLCCSAGTQWFPVTSPLWALVQAWKVEHTLPPHCEPSAPPTTDMSLMTEAEKLFPPAGNSVTNRWKQVVLKPSVSSRNEVGSIVLLFFPGLTEMMLRTFCVTRHSESGVLTLLPPLWKPLWLIPSAHALHTLAFFSYLCSYYSVSACSFSPVFRLSEVALYMSPVNYEWDGGLWKESELWWYRPQHSGTLGTVHLLEVEMETRSCR